RVHRYAARRALADWSDRARSGVKRAIRATGYEPPSIEPTLKAVRHVDLGAAMNALGAWVKHDAELRIYRIRPDAAPPPEPGFIPQKDGVEALLKLEPAETRQSRQSFLKTALDRLESGQHIFTITRGGRLEQYLWLADERRGTLFSALEQSFPLTEP